MAFEAEVGDIVTGVDADGVVRIGRVAAMFVAADGTPSESVTVATPDGDWRAQRASLRVVRPNFVQETWASLGYEGLHPWSRNDDGAAN